MEPEIEPAPKPNPAYKEMRLFIAGAAIWVFLAAEFLVLAFLARDQARGMVAGLVAELLTGREGGIPVGLQAGAHPLLMWQVSFLQDFGTAFLGYPLFLYLIHRYHDSDVYLMRRLRRIEAKASEHQAYVHKWGPLGVSLFMLVPFLVNGPFVALILGRICGIRTRNLLGPVMVTTILVAGAWVLFFDQLFALVNAVDQRIGYYVAGGTVLIIATLGLIDFWREHREIAKAES